MDSSLKPYEYSTPQKNYYAFITDRGDEYRCFFLSYSLYFQNHPDLASYVYGFNIERLNTSENSKGDNKRLAATVVKIVGDFLVSETDAVVYVCDQSDGSGEARMRKFNRWFEFYTHESAKIYQVTAHFDAGGMILYTALLLNKNNPLKAKFAEAFMELNENAGK